MRHSTAHHRPPANLLLRRRSFAVEAGPTWFDRLKGGLDLEEALGSNWLNKIGIVLVVLGVASFLAYQLRQVGPLGKVLVGVLVSLTLLVGGIFLERKKGYRILGRAGIGGGWALTFFTAYAMYHVRRRASSPRRRLTCC